MKDLFIIRGVSGCGKSTLAHKIAEVVCEADDFFTVEGEYKFDPKSLQLAHSLCKEKCKHSMKIGMGSIAVSNTSTMERDLSVYIDLAKQYGYMVTVIVVENRNNTVNEHKVPEDVLMRQKFHLEKSIKLM